MVVVVVGASRSIKRGGLTSDITVVGLATLSSCVITPARFVDITTGVRYHAGGALSSSGRSIKQWVRYHAVVSISRRGWGFQVKVQV